MILVHLLHNCLLSSQQSLSHKWSRGKQHSPHKCSLGDTSLNKVGGIQGKRCDSTKAPPALTQRIHSLQRFSKGERRVRQGRGEASVATRI